MHRLGILSCKGSTNLVQLLERWFCLRETATAPIFAVDGVGRINGWNAKMAELTGLSVEDAMGKSLVHDLVSKEWEETVDQLLNSALRGEEDKNVEIKLKTFGQAHDQNVIYLLVNACYRKTFVGGVLRGSWM
ncbi:hypothetical protein MLD38_010727 [Melastoma candidum]|uniref:Uncharacterized protein n=1 Tax=Melastoma candidum TaxID=119954 RepID=A0ACB9R0U4_9MYRT|nr:hypothetical protein MLD38_010727 [Melastoma candidum]